MAINYYDYPVLYVDDEKPNLVAMRYAMEEHFNLITTASPEEALRILSEQDIAVLLADQRMPDMTGVELCERARELRPDVVRIIITAYADLHAAIDAINRGGVTRYVTKPYRNDELAQVLRAAIDLVHLERTVRDMEQRLLRMGQNTTATAVHGMVAHEIRNAITPIRNLHDIAEDLVQALSQSIHEDTERAEKLVNDLRDTHKDKNTALNHIEGIAERLRQGRSVPSQQARSVQCDAGRVVDSTVRILRREMGAVSIQIVLESSPVVPMEASALGQIIMNLLINAAHAVGDRPEADAAIEVRIATAQNSAQVMVSDNGPGVPDEIAERIFDPHFTTKESGSGLGLSIARRLVNDAGGELRLDPSRQGATFVLELPVVESAQGSHR